ncbi:hypothetical protein [Vibrio gallaecicus]|uniref:hypothetical protein n=1 Tax=Vibrio gallaecicus TaxID=552386 RepID=UPI0025B2E992|nr:hypothetical protein [Vibrio gallaecicus]MDN3616514.1 hypothetical protein [Vibrio gallaecicus]
MNKAFGEWVAEGSVNRCSRCWADQSKLIGSNKKGEYASPMMFVYLEKASFTISFSFSYGT